MKNPPEHRIQRISELSSTDPYYKINLLNSLTGIKSANLIGTLSPGGIENLALFSSAVHLGADPALIGMILRPLTVGRQTYDYIHHHKEYTMNQVHASFIAEAHWSSAKFAAHESEFSHCGLTPAYAEGCKAPFVVESPLSLGLRWVEEYPIKANGTILMVGEVLWVRMDESRIADDGNIDLAEVGATGISGLEQYYTFTKVASFAFARSHSKPRNRLER